MRRRVFIALFGAAAAGLPFAAHAQQKVPRIGILMTSGPDLLGPFREAFRELGYIEGQTIQFELREGRGRLDLLSGMAEELVRGNVDVIVASQTPAAIAAKNATRSIPIVMGAAGDPIATGLVTSLARPEGNVTGLSATSAELAAKNLELIREILPRAHRVGVVGNATDPFAKPFLEQIHRGALGMRFEIHDVLVRATDELDGAIAAIAKQNANAIIIQGSLPPKITIDLGDEISSSGVHQSKDLRGGGRTRVVQRKFRRAGPRNRELRGQDTEGSQTRRSAGAAAQHV